MIADEADASCNDDARHDLRLLLQVRSFVIPRRPPEPVMPDNLAPIDRPRWNRARSVSPLRLDPHWGFAWLPAGLEGVRAGLRWASHHTGMPLIVVSAVALVISWRLFGRAVRFAFEVALAVGLLAVATKLGWVTW